VVSPREGGALPSSTRHDLRCATDPRLAPEANPIDVVAAVALEKTPGLHSAAVGVDPRTWEVVRFELWEEHPGEEGVYEVLHFSEPELDQITAG